MNCKDIIKEYLEKNGYAGLVEYDCTCGCLLDDLMPCRENFELCSPAYRHVCFCPEHDGFHLCNSGPQTEEELRIARQEQEDLSEDAKKG